MLFTDCFCRKQNSEYYFSRFMTPIKRPSHGSYDPSIYEFADDAPRVNVLQHAYH